MIFSVTLCSLLIHEISFSSGFSGDNSVWYSKPAKASLGENSGCHWLHYKCISVVVVVAVVVVKDSTKPSQQQAVGGLYLSVHLDPFIWLDVVQRDGGGGFVHQNCGHWFVRAGGSGHTDRHQPQVTLTWNQSIILELTDSLEVNGGRTIQTRKLSSKTGGPQL